MTKFLELLQENNLKLCRVKPTFELAQEILEIIDRNRLHLRRWLLWVDNTKTLEDTYNGLQYVYDNEWSYLIFIDNKIVGSIGIVKKDEKQKKLEIGYWLDKKFSGHGIITRAVRLLENMVFETNEWHRIEILCDPQNEKSLNVPKRCGYILDGVLREDYLYRDGTFGDTMVFSKLINEWTSSKKRTSD